MINLTGAMAEGITKEEDDWGQKNLHVSDLGVSYFIEDDDDRKCPRQLWLRLNGYDRQPQKPGTSLMFEQGHNLEEHSIRWIRRGLNRLDNRAIVVGEQIDVSAGISPLAGHLDLLIEKDMEYLVVDVKSRRGASFDYVDEIKPTNKMQIAGYIYALRNLGLDVEHGAVLEVDRNGQRFVQEFHFRYDSELEFKVENTIIYLKQIRDLSTPPARLKPKIKINRNKGDDSVTADVPWQCSYCDYWGVSCRGAIPEKYSDRLGKVVGHISGNTFVEKAEGIGKYIKGELDELTK